jgi:sodium transport system permease protein
VRIRIIWTIFRKEIVETLRDRRTLLMMVGLPVLLYPMMIICVSWFQRSQTEKREERASEVAVWGEEAPQIVDWLGGAGKLTLKRWAAAPSQVQAMLRDPAIRPARAVQEPEEALGSSRRTAATEAENPVLAAARAAISEHTVDAVLITWPGLMRSIGDDGLGSITVYYDSVQPDSVLARDRLVETLGRYRATLVQLRERSHSLAPGFAVALDVLQRNVASEQRRGGELLGMLLPFILIVMSLLGGLYPAIDLTAGEKERGTMQTLMCAPVSPQEIIVGKFLTVWAIALITALVNVISLAATLARLLPGTNLHLPLASYLATFGMLVPVTLIISALFLAVAAFARDFKDGQNFLTPVYMVLAMPAVATMLPGVQLTTTTAFLPVVNIALLIKSVMLSEAAPDLVFLALLSSLTYSGLALVLAARVFQQEQVLLGGQQSIVDLLGLRRRAGRTAGPGVAIVSFAIVLVVVFYGSLLLQRAGIVAMVLVTEYAFFLLPTLAIVFWLGYPARETLALRVPPLRALIGSVLVGVSAWTVAAGVLIRLLPPPESLVRALERILLLDGKSPSLWIVWLIVGVTPAICEELFFRGFVLSGLRRLGILPALLVSALLFGLAHSSIYRLLPTAFLGVLFGYAVWRTGSVACGITAHALNNGLMATMVLAPSSFQWLGMGKGPFLPWTPTAFGAGVAIVGLLLIRSVPQFNHARAGSDQETSPVPAG